MLYECYPWICDLNPPTAHSGAPCRLRRRPPVGGSELIAALLSGSHAAAFRLVFCGCCAACTQKEQFLVQSPGRGAAAGRGVPLRAGGCAAEPLPAAETAEAEQGQPSKYASGLRPAPHIWVTAIRMDSMINQKHSSLCKNKVLHSPVNGGAVNGSEPLSRGGGAAAGLHL